MSVISVDMEPTLILAPGLPAPWPRTRRISSVCIIVIIIIIIIILELITCFISGSSDITSVRSASCCKEPRCPGLKLILNCLHPFLLQNKLLNWHIYWHIESVQIWHPLTWAAAPRPPAPAAPSRCRALQPSCSWSLAAEAARSGERSCTVAPCLVCNTGNVLQQRDLNIEKIC